MKFLTLEFLCLSVGVTIGRGPQALLKMLSSPQEWIALYDGQTTLNPLSISTPSSSHLRAAGMVTSASNDSSTTMVDGDTVMEIDAGKGASIRAVDRKPSSTLEC
jgi:hypothetical protein